MLSCAHCIKLPNLCYIGGGWRIAYWLELKSFFEAVKLLPHVVQKFQLIYFEEIKQKTDKLNLSWTVVVFQSKWI
jgi:hypothetical protein